MHCSVARNILSTRVCFSSKIKEQEEEENGEEVEEDVDIMLTS